MDDHNGNCFDHHDEIFAPLPVNDADETDCLKDFLLEPSRPASVLTTGWQALPFPPAGYEAAAAAGAVLPASGEANIHRDATNGDCWSPATFTASTSERTVSSDCVSSENVCSPSEVDSPTPRTTPLAHQDSVTPSPPSMVLPPAPPPTSSARKSSSGDKKRNRKRKSGENTHRRPRSSVATYESQISPDQNGIKLKIKKSFEPLPSKSRKRKTKESASSEWEQSSEPQEQSVWGSSMPKVVLHRIFELVTLTEGSVPFLARVSRVCRLWRDVAIAPSLWRYVDLSQTWVKDRGKNAGLFRWLCDNRLALVHYLNIGGWEFDGIPGILDKMASSCGEMRGLSLTGWQGLSADHIKFLIANCPKLQRLDLSCINPEMNNPKSAVSMTSLVSLAQEMNERLTQLVISDNKLSGIPQILQAITNCCPMLEVLDLSNVRTVSHTTAPLHIEKLQQGCPRLRVLRIANSEISLAQVSLKEQSLSEGFPELEELSVAGAINDTLSSRPIIDDDGLLRILKTSCKLRLLDVRGCGRLTDSSLVRVPAWDMQHLHLAGCYITRVNDSGLELICQKWAHSLIEVDLAWSTATEPLDAAVTALASHSAQSPLRSLNLCGSSVSMEPVRAVLESCSMLTTLNLSSCRALPRGIKRLYQGETLNELRLNILGRQQNSDSPQ